MYLYLTRPALPGQKVLLLGDVYKRSESQCCITENPADVDFSDSLPSNTADCQYSRFFIEELYFT